MKLNFNIYALISFHYVVGVLFFLFFCVCTFPLPFIMRIAWMVTEYAYLRNWMSRSCLQCKRLFLEQNQVGRSCHLFYFLCWKIFSLSAQCLPCRYVNRSSQLKESNSTNRKRKEKKTKSSPNESYRIEDTHLYQMIGSIYNKTVFFGSLQIIAINKQKII